ncbi:B9 domain-containing protein 1 [Tritrichomonas foetus]|uniref:B9 domain-containing protein 1 n=1 Tax=Tritrichomonas foetus TaxID=1144522 RepID=A0A1J4JUG0_9EUKA|nr:B9 domain-containing protein 1 [Tritrichomonas foetus]|eukprot:OHT02346.1 B9 domain-containing protein 1 [Tritrichomonas foetus]
MADLPLTITLTGQINECTTTIANNIYCKYIFSYGRDWSIGQGPVEGVTQTAKRGADNVCVFNFPLSLSFKSSKPFGWPQLIVAIYGHNAFGNDMIVGYGAIHVPTFAGRHELDIPLFTPASASIMQTIIGFFSGVTPEYIDLKFIAGGADREVTKTKSQGKVTVTFNVTISDVSKIGLILKKE